MSKPGVRLGWRTGSESHLLGFVVLRADGKRWVRLNKALIPAGKAGHRYVLRDRA